MKLFDVFLAILVPVIWGLGFTLAKVAFVYDAFPPILLMAFRFGLTALTLVFFVPVPKGYLQPIFWISLVSATIQYSLTFTGVNGVDASTAVIVVQLEFPFMALLAAVLLKDRLGTKGILGVVFAFCGIILIAGQPYLRENLFSVFLVASGACVWAFGQIMIKRLNGAVAGFTLIAWVAVFATPQLFLMSYLVEGNQLTNLGHIGWIGWGVVLYLGLAMTALGYGIWYHLLGRYPVTKVGPVLLLLPVTSIASSVVLLGERLTWVEILGAVIVIAGVWFVTTRPHPA